MKKYLVFPGEVRSKTDGDIHHIGFARLCDLYDISMREAINYDTLQPFEQSRFNGLIRLFPRESGDYTLPSADT